MTRYVRPVSLIAKEKQLSNNFFPQLYLTKPDYDEALLERILWEDRERVNSEEAYRKIYQSNSGALVNDILREKMRPPTNT